MSLDANVAPGSLALSMSDVLERKCRLCGNMVPAKSPFCSRCGAAAEQPGADEDDELATQIRALFSGEIAIDREIGRGAMAIVYLGFDLELERRVAIKALLPDVAWDTDIADRFKREAKLIAALNHPNIIPIYAVRNSATISAIIMQFVDGNSLDVVLRERDASLLPLPLAGLILSQAAAGLEHAHTRGIVHRDVKPANVLLDPGGQVFVSDFGIARWDGGVSATGSGVMLGTASYMSPEQCRGQRADARSDQYALGVMAFEMLAGRRPFIGRVSDLFNAHINSPPPRLSGLRADVSPEIESFVMRMLEKDPALRHQSLRDAERFFRRLVADERSATTQLKQVSLRKPIGRARARDAVTEAPATIMRPEAPPRGQDRRPLGMLAAGVGVAAVLVAGSAVLLRPAPRVSESVVSPTSRQSVALPIDTPKKQTRRSTAPPTAQSEPTTQQRAAKSQPSAATTEPATTEPATKPAAETAPPIDMTTPTRQQGEVQTKSEVTPPPPAVIASVADARSVANEFLTLCNHRQWRDVERLQSLEGVAELRTELIRLVRSSPDFQAGFERLASRPVLGDRTFATDFVLDLEWRGGQRQLAVTVSAELSNGSWHLAGFGVHPPD